jgi:hypothetical protein
MTIKELNSERTRDGYILITYRDSLGDLYKQKYSGYSIYQAKRLFIDKYSGVLAI